MEKVGIDRETLIKEYDSYAAVLKGQFHDGSQPTHPSDVAIAFRECHRIAELLGWNRDYYVGEPDPRAFGKIIDPGNESANRRLLKRVNSQL